VRAGSLYLYHSDLDGGGVLMLQTTNVSIWSSQQVGGGGGAGLLTANVLDSDANSFTVTQRAYNSGSVPFIVDADVLDSDGNPFTIFT